MSDNNILDQGGIELTLEPTLEEPKADSIANIEKPQPSELVQETMRQTALSKEEQKMVDDFAKKINSKDKQHIKYDDNIQKKLKIMN